MLTASQYLNRLEEILNSLLPGFSIALEINEEKTETKWFVSYPTLDVEAYSHNRLYSNALLGRLEELGECPDWDSTQSLLLTFHATRSS